MAKLTEKEVMDALEFGTGETMLTVADKNEVIKRLKTAELIERMPVYKVVKNNLTWFNTNSEKEAFNCFGRLAGSHEKGTMRVYKYSETVECYVILSEIEVKE